MMIDNYYRHNRFNEMERLRQGNVPKLNTVIDFTHNKKKLTGKVVLTAKGSDRFEVEANGSRFLVYEWDNKYVSYSIIKKGKK